jgi:hypothetical protein
LARRAGHDRRARPIPAIRAQTDNAQRRDERRSADRRASNERWRNILVGAAEVGINRASLYYDVGTKEELLIALIADPEKHPELSLLFSERNHIAAIPEADGIMSNAEDYRQTLLAIIEQGVAPGVFRRDLDPRPVMQGVLGMHNWIHQWYVPGGRHSLTEIGHVFAEMTMSGLRP